MFGGTRHGTSEKLRRNASHSLHRLRNAWADVTLPSRVCGTVFSSQDQSYFLRALEKAPNELELIEAGRCFQ